MSRLTRKIKGCYCIDMITCLPMEYEQINKGNACVEKLGQLEDTEEELGIDLITLFKALKGIWLKDNQNKIYCVGSPYLCFAENWNRQLELQFRVADIYYYVKDYGKTWALTREELENDK